MERGKRTSQGGVSWGYLWITVEDTPGGAIPTDRNSARDYFSPTPRASRAMPGFSLFVSIVLWCCVSAALMCRRRNILRTQNRRCTTHGSCLFSNPLTNTKTNRRRALIKLLFPEARSILRIYTMLRIMRRANHFHRSRRKRISLLWSQVSRPAPTTWRWSYPDWSVTIASARRHQKKEHRYIHVMWAFRSEEDRSVTMSRTMNDTNATSI